MNCKSCKNSLKGEKISFGKNYQSSLFEKNMGSYKKNKKIQVSLIECKKCNLIQLYKAINYKRIIPKKKWIINKEEDKHHENYLQKILKKKFINKNAKVLFLSIYDNKFFEFLRKKGFKNLQKLDLRKFLKTNNQDYNRQEFIQNFLNLKTARKFFLSEGSFDLIIGSKILEHTQNIKNFFTFCKNILKKNGFLIIDVPDCEKSLLQGNITMPWEEHISYFTTNTLNRTLALHKFKKINFKKYHYKQENALVGLYQNKDRMNKEEIVFKKNKHFDLFKKKINIFKNNTRKFFKKYSNFSFYIFGAGHNAVVFFNFLKLSNKNIRIIDDNKNKKNCFFPGSDDRINQSKILSKLKKNKIILLSVNIEIEKKIITKIKNFLNKNDKILSIYPDSPRFFLKKKYVN